MFAEDSPEKAQRLKMIGYVFKNAGHHMDWILI